MNERARNRLAGGLVVASLIGAASVPVIQFSLGQTRSTTNLLAGGGTVVLGRVPARALEGAAR